jgi:hypothetical protein
MSADKDRAIRRTKQKRAKQLKKSARRATRAGPGAKTTGANASSAAGSKAG